MKKSRFLCMCLILCVGTASFAGTYYVAPDGNDGNNGSDWDHAFLTISKAVEAAADGDDVLVADGRYPVINQIEITKGIEVKSLNGPEVTVVYRSAGSSRVFRLEHEGAVLSGFTITNGTCAAQNNQGGAGVRIDNAGTVTNCIIKGNRVPQNGYGGGVYLGNGGHVINCQITENINVSRNGAGVTIMTNGLVENCVISSNSCVGQGYGGGVYLYKGGVLKNCLICDNQHASGSLSFGDVSAFPQSGAGGVGCNEGGRLENCTITKNFSRSVGGVFCNKGGTLLNCIVYDNTSSVSGYANCMNKGTGWSYSFCCTVPEMEGTGNIEGDPQLNYAVNGAYRLLPGSPCIDAGENQGWMTGAVDLDGNPRIYNDTVDIGAYEYTVGALECNPKASLPYTAFMSNNVVFTGCVAGVDTTGLYYKWDFDNSGVFDEEGADKRVVTNLYGPGLYSVRLEVNNGSETAEYIKTDFIKVAPDVAYVSPAATPVYPYTNWDEAANDIQSAIDACEDGSLVLVAEGAYAVTQAIDLVKGITLRGANGYTNTIVKRFASGTITRLFYMDHPNAVLDGISVISGKITAANSAGAGIMIDYSGGTVMNCLISSNSAAQNSVGGGIYIVENGHVKNCVIRKNSACWGGAGVYITGAGTLVENCEITENWSDGWGGGGRSGAGAFVANNATLRNCLVYNNTYNFNTLSHAYQAAGVYCTNATVINCTIVSNYSVYQTGGLFCDNKGNFINCIVFDNTGPLNNNHNNPAAGLSYCCTTPLPAGDGNLDVDPAFIDAVARNYRLAGGSPCINAGENQAWMMDTTDLDGRQRLIGARVDLGAYETPSQGSVFSFY